MKVIERIALIVVFLFLSIETGILSQGIGKDDISDSAYIVSNDRVPYNIQHIKRSDTPYAILVEKNSQKLFLYSIEDKPRFLKSYYCSTGKVNGSKKESGDLKTPEGIYYFNEIKEESELPEKYGVRAFVMNYPNRFDLLKKKDGFGIWLHGTNEPIRARLPYSTEGCVIVNNDDIMKLSNYIILNKTPIIVEEELDYLSLEQGMNDKNEMENFINNWIESWKNMNIDKYIENYSKLFYSQKKNWRRWRNYKRRLFNKYSYINVEIDDLSIIEKGNNYIINFKQKFMSDQYSDYGTKRLYIIKSDGKFNIINEEWEEVVPFYADVKRGISNGK